MSICSPTSPTVPREITRAINKASINTGARHRARWPRPTATRAARCSMTPSTSPRTTSCSPETGRKILVILTDGQDQGSQVTIKTAIEAAQKANVIVYLILIADPGPTAASAWASSGAGDMERLAKDTGGRVINVGKQRPQAPRSRLRPDSGRAAHPVPRQLHAHRPQNGWHLPHPERHLRQRPEGPGPQRLLRHGRRTRQRLAVAVAFLFVTLRGRICGCICSCLCRCLCLCSCLCSCLCRCFSFCHPPKEDLRLPLLLPLLLPLPLLFFLSSSEGGSAVAFALVLAVAFLPCHSAASEGICSSFTSHEPPDARPSAQPVFTKPLSTYSYSQLPQLPGQIRVSSPRRS